MTVVTFFEKDGRITKVRASGHSGFAESGNDIVCAAVSTLVQTAYLALKDIDYCSGFVRDDDSGLFEFSVGGDGDGHDADVILRALVVGLEDLRSGYPQYINTKTVREA